MILYSLKEKSEETIIYEVLWGKADDVTSMSPMIHFNIAVASEQQMHFKYLNNMKKNMPAYKSSVLLGEAQSDSFHIGQGFSLTWVRKGFINSYSFR